MGVWERERGVDPPRRDFKTDSLIIVAENSIFILCDSGEGSICDVIKEIDFSESAKGGLWLVYYKISNILQCRDNF